jgi:hypothetical protein
VCKFVNAMRRASDPDPNTGRANPARDTPASAAPLRNKLRRLTRI